MVKKEPSTKQTDKPTENKATQTESTVKGEVRTPKKTSPKSRQAKSTKEKELAAKLKEQQDKYLRLSADFDNYRKRTMKEKMDLAKYAGGEVLTQLLPVLDDFERAVSSMNETEDISAVREGVDLIYSKFKEFLNQQGVKEIEALDQEFNTDYHEAVTKIPVTEKDRKGMVVDVIEKGYELDGKVIRYSKVVVGD